MPGAREEVMARVREALRDVPPEETPDDVAVTRDYARSLDVGADERLDMFAGRVAEYRATVHRVADVAGLASALTDACERHGVQRLVVADGVPEAWRPSGVELVEDAELSHSELDAADGVLTGCAAGIALTGTIALQSGALSGRRAITLLPDLHLCVIEAGQVLERCPSCSTPSRRPRPSRSSPAPRRRRTSSSTAWKASTAPGGSRSSYWLERAGRPAGRVLGTRPRLRSDQQLRGRPARRGSRPGAAPRAAAACR
jgi:L-lactate dehydrogenase complex protein LldG